MREAEAGHRIGNRLLISAYGCQGAWVLYRQFGCIEHLEVPKFVCLPAGDCAGAVLEIPLREEVDLETVSVTKAV